MSAPSPTSPRLCPPTRRRCHRGARRGLYEQGRFRRAQRPAGAGSRRREQGGAPVRQPAQRRRRFAAPEEPRHHRRSPLALPGAWLGRGERGAGRDAVRHGRGVRRWGFPIADAFARVPDAAAALAIYRTIEAQRADLPFDIDGVVYKVDRWTGRPGWALSGARRAGRSRTNSPPSARRPRSEASKFKWEGRER